MKSYTLYFEPGENITAYQIAIMLKNGWIPDKLGYVKVETYEWDYMDEKFKTEWIKALRSKRYKQYPFQLGSADKGYCCLGIGALVARRENILKYDEFKTNIDNGNIGITDYIDFNYMNWPFWFRKKMNISDQHHYELIKMNDNGWTFEEIADWIETNL